MSNLFDLTGRTALVTGSSRGLGLAIAEGLADAGAAVVLNGSDAGRLAAAAATLREQGAHGPRGGVRRDGRGRGRGRLRPAGRGGGRGGRAVQQRRHPSARGPIVDCTAETWRRVLDTNLTSAFLIGREAARRMIARGRGGKVVNTGSLMSAVGRATVAPYTAAKGGIKMLTQAMTAEWAEHGIQANAIGPATC